MPQHRAAVFAAVRQWLDAKGYTPERIAELDRVLDAAGVPRDEAAPVTAPFAQPRQLRDPAAFFASLRSSTLFPAGMKQEQVDGINAILGAAGKAGWPIAYTSYGLGTGYHETNATMQPVREAYWLSEEWRKSHLRYYPHYGRGLVQITWLKNYQRADDELGLGGRLVADLDLAMQLDIAAQIMVRGMQEGWFGQRLGAELPTDRPATFEEFKASRPSVNVHDRDVDVANYALAFQAALTAGGYA